MEQVTATIGKTAEKITSFTGLRAWQEGHKMVLMIYRMTKKFPKDEEYGLKTQIQRAVVSITSNIAGGFRRRTRKEKIRFYSMALSSLTEVQNQLLIARDVSYIVKEEFLNIAKQSVYVAKLINALIAKTRTMPNVK